MVWFIASVLFLSESAFAQPDSLSLEKVEPCYAMHWAQEFNIPEDVPIIDFLGHSFRKKDRCVAISIKAAWTEKYFDIPHHFYELRFKQTYPGELWYRTDTQEVAFAAASMGYQGGSRLIGFSASGESCMNRVNANCKKWLRYEKSHAHTSSPVGGEVSFHFPPVAENEDPSFSLEGLGIEFNNGNGGWSITPTVVNRFDLVPFSYQEIVAAVQQNQSLMKTIAYRDDHNVDDSEPSRRQGHVELTLTPSPACPKQFEIEIPDEQKEIVFSESMPGKVQFSAKIKGDFSEEELERVVWDIPEKEGSVLSVSPANRRGAEIVMTYEGLPKFNRDLGKTVLHARLDLENHCPVFSSENSVKLFFPRDQTNNPRGDEPNWHYYWQQTSAGARTVRDLDIRYFGWKELCGEANDWMGYYPLDRLENAFGNPFHKGRDYVAICDFRKSDIPGTPPGNFFMSALTQSGRSWEGIDTFAVVVRHELEHRQHWRSWWNPKGGWPEKGYYDENENGVMDSTEVFVDEDLDYFLDGAEALQGYDKTLKKTHVEFSQEFMHDEHHLTYQKSEAAWTSGSADAEDWAKPGTQWFKN